MTLCQFSLGGKLENTYFEYLQFLDGFTINTTEAFIFTIVARTHNQAGSKQIFTENDT